jgi:hypothetical protein
MVSGNVPGYSAVIYLGDVGSLAVLCNRSDYSGQQRCFAAEIAGAFWSG